MVGRWHATIAGEPMTAYTPPLREIRFVLEDIVGLDRLAALPGCAELGADDIAAILEQAGRFAAGILAPLNRVGDLEGSRLENGSVITPTGFRDAYAAFCDGGWCAISAEEEFGGMGLPRLVATAVWELWNSANMAFSLCPLLTDGAVTLLAEHGTAEQKATYLPKMVSGEWTGAMVITEPHAGSNVGAMTTKAMPDGDAWRLRGQKIFISYGDHDLTDNVIHLVLARIEGAPAGNRGLSLFLVPKFIPDAAGNPGRRNDMRPVALEHKLGIHASPTCVMEYGGSEGAIGWLVGEANKGLAAMFTMMNAARMAVGHEGLGVAERAYQQAAAYARERLQGNVPGHEGQVPIIRHADVRRMLAAMKVRIEAMRALALEAALSADLAARHPDGAERTKHAARVGVLTPIVKAWCTDGAVEVASTAIQIHGGAGFIEETGVAQHLRDARITPIYEGTNGIQALDLVRRKLAPDGGAGIREMIGEIAAWDSTLAGEPGYDFAGIRAGLSQGVAALTRATDVLLERLKPEPDVADAGAVPYLDLFGTVLGGYLLARGAVAANRHLAQGQDREFHAWKLAAAAYYADTVLPRATALEHAVVQAARTLPLLAEENF